MLIKLTILPFGTFAFDSNGNKQYFPTEDEAVDFYRERERELQDEGEGNE